MLWIGKIDKEKFNRKKYDNSIFSKIAWKSIAFSMYSILALWGTSFFTIRKKILWPENQVEQTNHDCFRRTRGSVFVLLANWWYFGKHRRSSLSAGLLITVLTICGLLIVYKKRYSQIFPTVICGFCPF